MAGGSAACMGGEPLQKIAMPRHVGACSDKAENVRAIAGF
jgi:hypothetical protein